MRTSLDLPDALFRELKMEAVQRGITLKQLLRAAVENELRRGALPNARRVQFPVLKSKEPATLSLTNAEIDDLLA